MRNKAELYEVFGEMIYVLAMADGTIQKEELDVIEKKLAKHPWGKEIKWSFEYEVSKKGNIEDLFQKVISACEMHGPDREYEFLIDVMEEVAEASDGIDENEEFVIDVVRELSDRFKEEIGRINTQKTDSPSMVNLLLEGRVVLEWPSIFVVYPFIPKRVKAEGQPVLLIPPFLGTDKSTTFIRKYLKDQGFIPYKWDIGRNYIRKEQIPDLEKKISKIISDHGQKVSLVGWSAGGLLAKILANRNPDMVAQIITIGSPVWGLKGMNSNADRLYELTRGKSKLEGNEDLLPTVEAIPAVPITCIYTKTDGIVPWKYCCEAESRREDIRNIQVYGSHCGLGANPAVLLAVAKALKTGLNGKTIDKVSDKFEQILFPEFWQKRSKTAKGIFSKLFHRKQKENIST
jgi:dienelactone hydrolase